MPAQTSEIMFSPFCLITYQNRGTSYDLEIKWYKQTEKKKILISSSTQNGGKKKKKISMSTHRSPYLRQ